MFYEVQRVTTICYFSIGVSYDRRHIRLTECSHVANVLLILIMFDYVHMTLTKIQFKARHFKWHVFV